MKKYIIPFIITFACVVIFENRDTEKISYSNDTLTKKYQLFRNTTKSLYCPTSTAGDEEMRNESQVVELR
ncbi:MAG: hypothetical protein QM751_04530 [Paludibacteraceae bacterium]